MKRKKIYLGWIWLNTKNGSYTDSGPNVKQGWTERHLIPFQEDCWGWVPCPPWEEDYAKYDVAKAKEILSRAERIPYNPNWTLLEQNQLQAAKDLAKLILKKDK